MLTNRSDVDERAMNMNDYSMKNSKLAYLIKKLERFVNKL